MGVECGCAVGGTISAMKWASNVKRSLCGSLFPHVFNVTVSGGDDDEANLDVIEGVKLWYPDTLDAGDRLCQITFILLLGCCIVNVCIFTLESY